MKTKRYKLCHRTFYSALLLLPSLVLAAQWHESNNVQTPQVNSMIQVSGGQQSQSSYERIFWNKAPISIRLKTGSERMIHFPDMIRVMPPKERSNKELKITVVDNVIYLKALSDFTTGRMRVQLFNHNAGNFEGGRLYLFDLSALPQGGTETIELIDKTRPANVALSTITEPGEGDERAAAVTAEVPHSVPDVDMVGLVRYVSQQLYAPERLMPSHSGIYRTALRANKVLHTLYRGGELQATPLASWKGGRLYVTAVKIQNKTHTALTLDPRKFRGQWRSRTLQHTRVSAYASETDTTTVYLVSDRPFDESLWF